MGLLKDFKGAIQSDGYIVYEHFEGMEGKLLLGCWAHARRKFFEARKENEKLANEALFYIGKLYEVERDADALDMTARNILLRAEYGVKSGQPQPVSEYLELRDGWGVTPWLETRLAEILSKHLSRYGQ